MNDDAMLHTLAEPEPEATTPDVLKLDRVTDEQRAVAALRERESRGRRDRLPSMRRLMPESSFRQPRAASVAARPSSSPRYSPMAASPVSDAAIERPRLLPLPVHHAPIPDDREGSWSIVAATALLGLAGMLLFVGWCFVREDRSLALLEMILDSPSPDPSALATALNNPAITNRSIVTRRINTSGHADWLIGRAVARLAIETRVLNQSSTSSDSTSHGAAMGQLSTPYRDQVARAMVHLRRATERSPEEPRYWRTLSDVAEQLAGDPVLARSARDQETRLRSTIEEPALTQTSVHAKEQMSATASTPRSSPDRKTPWSAN